MQTKRKGRRGMSGPLINIFLVAKRPIVVLHVGDVV